LGLTQKQKLAPSSSAACNLDKKSRRKAGVIDRVSTVIDYLIR
jgi:hypothetical protein